MEIVEGKFKSFQVNFIDGDRSHRYPKVEEFIEQGVAFLNGESINTGIVDLSKANFISEEKYDSIKKGRVSLGDIVMTTRGNGVGQVAYIYQEIKGLINAQMLIIRSDNETINSLFLFYYMSSKAIQQQIRNFSSGSAQPQIPIKDLKSLYLSIPKAISTQQKIASILSAYDELIENNKQRIKLLEEMAEEIYKEWFVRLRFPNYENTEFVDGLPKGWEPCYLIEIIDVLSGGTPQTSNKDFWNGAIPFFSPKDYNGDLFCFETEGQITELGLKNCNSGLFCEDTVIITARGTVGNIVVTGRPMAMNQSCFALKGKFSISNFYIYQLLSENVKHLKQVANGATFSAITIKTFEQTKIVRPTFDIIQNFASHTISD